MRVTVLLSQRSRALSLMVFLLILLLRLLSPAADTTTIPSRIVGPVPCTRFCYESVRNFGGMYHVVGLGAMPRILKIVRRYQIRFERWFLKVQTVDWIFPSGANILFGCRNRLSINSKHSYHFRSFVLVKVQQEPYLAWYGRSQQRWSTDDIVVSALNPHGQTRGGDASKNSSPAAIIVVVALAGYCDSYCLDCRVRVVGVCCRHDNFVSLRCQSYHRHRPCRFVCL